MLLHYIFEYFAIESAVNVLAVRSTKARVSAHAVCGSCTQVRSHVRARHYKRNSLSPIPPGTAF